MLLLSFMTADRHRFFRVYTIIFFSYFYIGVLFNTVGALLTLAAVGGSV